MKKEYIWLTVGTLVAPQGLQGEIRVKPSSDFPERFTKPGKRWLQNGEETPQEVELLSGKAIPGKSIFVVRFEGVKDRNSAERLIGQKMLVSSHSRPELKKNEFHLLDLVGLAVKTTYQQEPIGYVTNLISGGNELLEIELSIGKKVLVPFVKEIVPEIQLKEKWLLVTPPPGLLEL